MSTPATLKKEPMSVVDTAWLRMDSEENLMVINGVILFREPFDRDRWMRIVEQRFLKITRFRCMPIQERGSYFWQELPQLDMNYHVATAELSVDQQTEAGLQQLSSQLLCETLDPQQPLWRFYHIPVYQGGSAVFFKVHHSYADGIALIGVLDRIADRSVLHSSPAARFRLPERKPAKPGVAGQIQYQLGSVGRALSFGSLWLYEALRVMLLSADSRTVYKQPLCADKQVAWAPSLPVAEVKQLAKIMNCTVNDVLLGCVAGSLRHNLEQQGENVDRLRVRATVPVNLRPLEQAGDMGNSFGLVYLDLPVCVADPAMRVRYVRQAMNRLKSGMQAKMSYGVLAILGYFPLALQRLALNFFSSKASAVMTNVPGPAEPVYLDGVKLCKPMFWVPQSGGIGLGISILSYDNQVEFGLQVDASLIADPQAVVDDFIQEYSKLKVRLLGDEEPAMALAQVNFAA
jgi:WS/DGAT/MGAT family acyltransferase